MDCQELLPESVPLSQEGPHKAECREGYVSIFQISSFIIFISFSNSEADAEPNLQSELPDEQLEDQCPTPQVVWFKSFFSFIMDPDGTVEFMEVRDRTPQQKKWLNWELKFRKGFKPNKQQFNAWLKAVEQRRHELQSSNEAPLVDNRTWGGPPSIVSQPRLCGELAQSACKQDEQAAATTADPVQRVPSPSRNAGSRFSGELEGVIEAM